MTAQPWICPQVPRGHRLALALSLSLAAGLRLMGATANAPMVYPAVGYDLSNQFQVAVNGVPVRVDHVLQVHVARFTFHDQADVVVRVRDPITTYRISPVSYGIRSQVEKGGREIRFSLDRPRQLVVYVNNLPRLFLWAEAPEEDPPQPGRPGVVDVTRFDAPTDGRHLATDAIRRAIEAVPAHGVLYFPPGIYLTGTIPLKSDMTMYLAGGARILGSPLRDDYPKCRDRVEADLVHDPDHHWRKGKELSYRQLLLLDRVENVIVRGRGIIDGNGGVLRPQGFFIFNTKIIESRNVRIEGVAFANSPAWNLQILYSDHVVVRGAKLIANMEVKNSDGIDPDASTHVLIEDNFFLCNDDFVAVKVTANAGLTRDVDDVVVRHNVAISEGSALKIGTELNDDRTIRNVLFEDNDVVECDRGMSVYLEDGGTAENIRYINNRFERLFIEGRLRLIDFYIMNRNGKGRIRDVLIKDCVALEPWPAPSSMEGLDADHRISGVRIDNLVIAGRPVRDAADIPLTSNAFVNGVTITAPAND